MSGWTKEDIEKMFREFTGTMESDDPKARKKLRIVEVATELFTSQGYRRTSVDDIAREAGVAKGTVYLYFKSKAEIAVLAIVMEKQRYFGLIAPCFEPDLDPREKLRLLIRGGFIMATAMPMTSRLIGGDREFVQLLNELPPGFLEQRQSIGHGFYEDFLREATPGRQWEQGELEEHARVLMTMVYFSGQLTEEKIRFGLSVEQVARILADLVIDGIDGPAERETDRKTGGSSGGES